MTNTIDKKVDIYGKGGRKTAVAVARLNGKNEIVVNGKPIQEYFSNPQFIHAINAPLRTAEKLYGINVKVSGSGIYSQCTAVQNAIAHLLVKHDITLRPLLRPFLTRDARAVEGKTAGHKKARKMVTRNKR